MTKQHHLREIPLDTVLELMPELTYKEQLEMSQELWEFFDALWAIAKRQVTEEELATRSTRATTPRPTGHPDIRTLWERLKALETDIQPLLIPRLTPHEQDPLAERL